MPGQLNIPISSTGRGIWPPYPPGSADCGSRSITIEATYGNGYMDPFSHAINSNRGRASYEKTTNCGPRFVSVTM